MDRAQRELVRGCLTKARDKARVARELFGKDTGLLLRRIVAPREGFYAA